MNLYTDKEKLNLTDKIYITKEVKDLIIKEKKRLEKTGRKVSRAKIVCNIIIKEYD